MSFLSKIIGFFEGRVKIYADSENRDKLASFFVNNKISVNMYADKESGGIYTEISPNLLKKIAPALDKLKIIVYIINIYGFKRTLSKYGQRYGLLLGFLTLVFFLWSSTLFVWKIDVSGTELVPKEQVISELSKMGVKVGARISDIDRSSVSNTFLKAHPELSWAALNFKGTTVFLTLKETDKTEEKVDTQSNVLVASESGVVSSVLVYEGVAAVKVGSVVKAGDVLITGLISGSGNQITDEVPLRLKNAKGSVKAEVIRTVNLTVPFCETETVFSKGKRCGRVISVFGYDFVFGDTENAVSEGEKHITVFGVIELPITVKYYFEQNSFSESTERSSEEARLLAEKRIYKAVSDAVGDGEVTFINTGYKETEEGYEVTAEYGCVVEITSPYRFEKQKEY